MSSWWRPVSSIYGLGDPATSTCADDLHLSRGERIDQRAILRRLAELQYKRNDVVAAGTFRVRGDVIDIFRPNLTTEAVRLELFDDEVEGISNVRPADRRGGS